MIAKTYLSFGHFTGQEHAVEPVAVNLVDVCPRVARHESLHECESLSAPWPLGQDGLMDGLLSRPPLRSSR